MKQKENGKFFFGSLTVCFKARFDLKGVVSGSPEDIPMGVRSCMTVPKDEAEKDLMGTMREEGKEDTKF